jgi:hypothetical protein
MTLAVSFVRASQVLLGLVLARFRAPLFCPFKTTFLFSNLFRTAICFVAFDRRTMDAALLNDLSTFTKDQTNWKCKLLVDDLDEQGRPITTDLIQYLVPNSKEQLYKQQFCNFPPKSWYWFSVQFNGMDRCNLLIKTIQELANESGFSLSNMKK